jgi:hypothetical protein
MYKHKEIEEVSSKVMPAQLQVVLAKQAEHDRMLAKKREILLDNVDALEKRVRPTIPGREWKPPKNDPRYCTYKMSPFDMFYGCLRYFRKQIRNDQPITLSGTALSIGYSRHQFWNTNKFDYSLKNKEYQFIPLIKGFVEECIETSMTFSVNPASDMFRLKNMGWTDKIDIETHAPDSLSEEDRIASQQRLKEFTETKEGLELIR